MRTENYYGFGGGEQPLCIYQGLDGIYVSLNNKGIQCVQQLNQSQVRVIDVFEKAPSLILDMTETSEKLVFSDASDHTLNYFADNKVTVTLGESEGFHDGYSHCFNSPSLQKPRRDFGLRTSGFGLRASGFGLRTSGFRLFYFLIFLIFYFFFK